MCVVSVISDHFQNNFPNRYPQVVHSGVVSYPFSFPVNREEFEALKKEVEDLKELLMKAKQYDEDTNQKDCEQEDKVAFFIKLGEMLGIDFEEVFGK